jgi:peptidoglycan/LPS O-acetylase OafA/YrhL
LGQTARKSLNALTSARFLAAFWVVLYHYTTQFRFGTPLQAQPYLARSHTPMEQLIGQGHLAVDFFFLLSGFILAYTYFTAEGTLRDGRRAFWVARIARIYPVYLLGLVLGLAPYLASERDPVAVVTSGVAHLLMLHAWLPSTLGWNQPSWSLSVEAFFYALFPLLLPLFARLRRRGLWVLFAASWLVFALVLLALLTISNRPEFVEPWWWRDVVRYNLLFIGYGREAITLLRRLADYAFDAAAVALALALAGALVLAHVAGFQSSDVDTAALVALPFLAALVYLFAFQRGALAGGLSLPLLVWLGEISYGVYILHAPLWYLLSGFAASALHLAPGSAILFPVYVILLLAVSGLSFQYLERPARRAIRSRWGMPKPAVVPRAPASVR